MHCHENGPPAGPRWISACPENIEELIDERRIGAVLCTVKFATRTVSPRKIIAARLSIYAGQVGDGRVPNSFSPVH